MDKEAPGSVVVHHRERAVRCSQSPVRRARDTERGDRREDSVRANLAPDCLGDDALVNRRGEGRAKPVDMQSLWMQEAPMSGRFVTKKVSTNVSPAEQLTKIMGYEFVGLHLERQGSCGARLANLQQRAESSLNAVSLAIGRTGASKLGQPPRVRSSENSWWRRT